MRLGTAILASTRRSATMGAVISDSEPSAARAVVVLGSTGSIGTQALEVIDAAPELFSVTALCAAGGKLELLAEQVIRWRVAYVGVSRATAAPELRERI